ncbi:MAG: lactonase family protein [Psychromonas sp.]
MKVLDRTASDSELSELGITRRHLVKMLAVAGSIATISPSLLANTATGSSQQDSNMSESYVYVGTYSSPNFAPGAKNPSTSKGIYVFKIDKSGNLELIQEVEAENPSFLTVSPSKQYLYCVNELGTNDSGEPLGRVSAYKIDPASGKINFINTELTKGTWPCHCFVHPSGKYLLSANYGSGSFPAHPILDDGSLGNMSDMFQSAGNGSGPDEDRQSGPHAHMILTNPGAQHVFGVDLGADKIISLNLDIETGKFAPGIVPNANLASGAGPRHMDFHPNDRFSYVLNELSSSIEIFGFNAERGSFTWIQNVSTLPEDTGFVRPKFDPTNPGKVPEGTNTTAEIRIHPSGKWLYATNRGMNSIAIFSVNPITGKLMPIDWVSSKGETPRGMNIEPSGAFLLVGNQNSDNIHIFKINLSDGKLEGPVQTIQSPVPVDIAFSPVV